MKRLILITLFCIISVSCSPSYSPVKHSFEILDKNVAMSQLCTLLIDSVYKDDGILFRGWVYNEKWFWRNYFKSFPEDFHKKYVMARVYTTPLGQYRVIFTNKTCTNEKEICVRHLMFVIGPPEKKGKYDNVIFSCKREVKDKETIYRLTNFPVKISLFEKGDGRADPFAVLQSVYVKDFTKYEELIQLIKSIYPNYELDCPHFSTLDKLKIIHEKSVSN